MRIEFTPIGVVHSPFTSTEGMPIQPSRAKGIRGTVEVFPQFAAGLDGTPLLDIKPYVSEFDESTQARFGWLEAARRREVASDDRFE